MLKRDKITAGIVFLVSVVIFSYIATKACVSSFTHDESFSYLHFISAKFIDIISNQGAFANNHLLNTAGMKYSDMLFGSSEFSLRLPNLIMLLVYLFYTWLLLKKTDPVLAVSIFILMATNTALIDFFGLARGYGMSIGFMIMSLYHLAASFNGHQNRNLILFNIGALLAILSNFTMLSFYLSALFIFNMVIFIKCHHISKEKFDLFRTNKINLILFLLFVVILYEPVRKAIKFNTFDFGGKAGFIQDTITSLIFHMFMNVHLSSSGILLLQISIMMLLFLPLAVILKNIYQQNETFFSRYMPLILTNLIFLSISIVSILQHYVLKTDYPVGRFSLFFVPLLLLNTGFLFEYLSQIRYRFFIQGLAVSLALLSASNFYLNKNLNACAEWGYDQETKNMMKALIQHHKNEASAKNQLKIGVNWLFEPTVNFYRQTMNIKWLIPADRNGLTAQDDYVYIFESDTNTLKNISREVVFFSDRTKTLLIKNIP